MADLVILAQRGDWASRFQATSLAAATVAAGRTVDLCLFFAALASWVEGRWGDVDAVLPLDSERIAGLGYPPLDELLAPGRESGELRLYACSASARFLDLPPDAVQAKVDAVLGWQTFARRVGEAGQVVAL